jgi:hypothetical protein
MDAMDQLKQAAETKHRESLVTSRAYATTLSALTPVNFILVVGAALLSLVAGASILIENNLLTNVQSGILALVSSALTLIHSKLGCEQYQAECRKLVSFHQGIAEDYSNLRIVDDVDKFRDQLWALNNQLSAMIKSSPSLPFNWTLERAKNEH